MIIKPLQDTLLKTHPIDSNTPKDKQPQGFQVFKFPAKVKDAATGGMKTNTLAATAAYQDAGKSIKITFEPHLTAGGVKHKQLYIYAPHWEGISSIIDNAIATATPFSPAGSSKVIHKCEHFAQRDQPYYDSDNRSGEYLCGATSQAIVASALMTEAEKKGFISKHGDSSGKLDRAICGYFSTGGFSSTSMESHVAMWQSLGYKAKARRDASIADLQEWVSTKGPVCIGTYYNGCSAGEYMDSTADGAGHFVAVVGYSMTKNEFEVFDPYGDRTIDGSGGKGTNGWNVIFDNENDVRPSKWPFQAMADLWAANPDGWAVFVEPKNPPATAAKSDAPTVTATATATETITVLADTFLKKSQASAATLADTEKIALKKGAVIKCTVIGAKAGHGQVKLEDGGEWWIFNQHFSGQEAKSGTNAVGKRDFPVDPGKLRSAIGKMAASGIPAKELDDFCEAFIEYAPKYTITKREHVIHFLAQVWQESGSLQFTEELASGSDYDYRCDLGNCESAALAAADNAGTSVGRHFKGMGCIQTTGYTNFKKFSDYAKVDGINNPGLLSVYPNALVSAMYFWSTQGPSLSVDAEGGINDATCEKITRVVNGGTNHLHERQNFMWDFNDLL